MKRIISVLLVFCLALSLSVCVSAADADASCPKIADVDDDNSVSVTDARLILRNAIGLDEFTETQTLRGDIDGGGVSVGDARLALRIAIKIDKAPAHRVEGGRCAICGEAIAAPVPAPVTENNEYNMLSGSKYYMKGAMTEGGVTTPMLLARDGNRMYMQSDLDGISIGILVRDGKLYMMTPDHKDSLEIDASVRRTMGMTDAEYNEMMNASNFAMETPPLEFAEQSVSVENSKAYTVFTFNMENGSRTEVKMDGDKLVSMTSYTPAGAVESVTTFEEVNNSPAESNFALPSGILHRYSGTAGMLLFLGKLGLSVE